MGRRTRAKVLAAVLRSHLVQHQMVTEEIVLVRGGGRAAGGETELGAVKVARGDHVVHGNAGRRERGKEAGGFAEECGQRECGMKKTRTYA